MPRVVIHESSSPTSYCVLSKPSLKEIRGKARHGAIAEEDCLPILRAVEVTLLTSDGQETCEDLVYSGDKSLTHCTPYSGLHILTDFS
jgi:hypothetical protein